MGRGKGKRGRKAKKRDEERGRWGKREIRKGGGGRPEREEERGRWGKKVNEEKQRSKEDTERRQKKQGVWEK